jgi:hypothetical protein
VCKDANGRTENLELTVLMSRMGCWRIPPWEPGNKTSLSGGNETKRKTTACCLFELGLNLSNPLLPCDGSFRELRWKVVKYCSAVSMSGDLRKILQEKAKQRGA